MDEINYAQCNLVLLLCILVVLLAQLCVSAIFQPNYFNQVIEDDNNYESI